MKRYLSLAFTGLLLLFAFGSCNYPENSIQITLNTGDSFQAANDHYPPGTVFFVRAGVHEKQSVDDPKTGNTWIGEKGAVMDGLNSISAAFSGKAEGVTIEGIVIKNYADNGIYFDEGSRLRLRRLTITDTGSGSGDENGAIRLKKISDITISHSYFTRVSAGILPTRCGGPVLIEWNTGINIGRNFIQLGRCKGAGIRIQNNTMKRQEGPLRNEAADVEDWISVYRSDGTKESPIRVRHNRARGHGYSKSGSFIMLGDAGGSFQIAEENVGVNPGQVGIGIAGGHNIRVINNILYSGKWEDSNVALYSADYSSPFPCDAHVIKNNRSLWFHRTGKQNNLFIDEENYCNTIAENNKFPDFSLNESVWESSEANQEN